MNSLEKGATENAPKRVTRREALKAIAAIGGATTLLTLPNKWEKPTMNVGTLSVSAQQCSPPSCATQSVITNLVASARQGSCNPIVGSDGDLHTLTLDYTDAEGLIPDQSWLRATFTFQPSGTVDSDETLLGPINITDNGGGGYNSGNVIVPVCIAFGSDTSVDVSVSVINCSCQPSNALTVSIANTNFTQTNQQQFKLNP